VTGKELGQALRSGKRVYGTLIVSTSPQWVAAVAALGLDYVFIDTEHMPIDRATLSWMCQAYRATGLPPMVRIPEPDPYRACMALDGGACGILAPYVETRKEVLALRGAVKLRPLKGRMLQEQLAGTRPLEPELARYVERRNENNLLFVNIESVPAMENLEEMLSVPGLDGVVIGPHDLSCSLGVPEQYDHPSFDRAVRHIIRASRSAGVGVGIHVHHKGCLEQEMVWSRAGANMILHSGDITLFAQNLSRDLDTMREALGGGPAPSDGGVVI
jgi:4-hydroxy-2-oxoheptanedioate aldolase